MIETLNCDESPKSELLTQSDIVDEAQRLLDEKLKAAGIRVAYRDSEAKGVPAHNRMGYVVTFEFEGSPCTTIVNMRSGCPLNFYDQELGLPLEQFSAIHLSPAVDFIVSMLASYDCPIVIKRLECPCGMEMSAVSKPAVDIRLVRGYDIRGNMKVARLDVLFGIVSKRKASAHEENGRTHLTIDDEYGIRTVAV